MNKLALALAAVLPCAGCALTSGPDRDAEMRRGLRVEREKVTAARAASKADSAAGRTDGVTAASTVTYWIGFKAALPPGPINPDAVMRDLSRLSTAGVDPDLLRETNLVSEKMWALSASIQSIPEYAVLFRYPRSHFARAEERGRVAVEQCRVVERMRADLTAKYGVEFPPIELPPEK